MQDSVDNVKQNFPMRCRVINLGVFYGGVDGDDDLAGDLRSMNFRHPERSEGSPNFEILPPLNCSGVRMTKKIKRQNIRRIILLEVFLIQRFDSGIRDKDDGKLRPLNPFMTQNCLCGYEDDSGLEWNSFLQACHCYGRWHFSFPGI